MNTTLDSLVYLLLGLGVLYVVGRAVSNVVLGSVLIGSTAIITIFYPQIPSISAGSFNWNIEDVISIALLCQLFLRPPSWRQWKGAHGLSVFFALFAIMVTVSLVRGLMVFPLRIVLNESRSWVFPLATIIYFSVVRASRAQIEKIGVAVEWIAFIMVVAAMARYALHMSADPGVIKRPVASGNAIFMACSAIYLWYRLATTKVSLVGKIAAASLPFVVILMQHRSVWISFGAMLLLVALFGLSIKQKGRRFIALGFIALLALVLMAPRSSLVKDLSTSVETSTGSHSTAEWREESWQELLSPSLMGPPINYVVGKPTGEGFFRKLFTPGLPPAYVDVGPHDLYVLLILRSGLIGLVGFVGFMLTLIFKLWNKGLEGRVLAIIQVGLLFYWLPYVFDEPQAFFVGLGLRLLLGLSEEGSAKDAPLEEPDLEREISVALEPSPVPMRTG